MFSTGTKRLLYHKTELAKLRLMELCSNKRLEDFAECLWRNRAVNGSITRAACLRKSCIALGGGVIGVNIGYPLEKELPI
jgi:hypothetical protein